MGRWAWALVLVGALSLVRGDAAAAVTETEVRARLESDYPVQVLRIRRGQWDDRDVFFVTMMNEGGDFNAAWQVTTVAVDAETGRLVPSFRHRASGADPNAAPGYSVERQPTDALQSGIIWR